MKIVVTEVPAGPAFIESPWNLYNRFLLEKLVRFEFIPAWIESDPFSPKVPAEIKAAYSGNLFGNEEFFRGIVERVASFENGLLNVHPCMFHFVLKEAKRLGISGKVELLSPVKGECPKAYSDKALSLLISLFGRLYYKLLLKEDRKLLFILEKKVQDGKKLNDRETGALNVLIDKVEEIEKKKRDIPPISIFNKMRELLLLHIAKNPFRIS